MRKYNVIIMLFIIVVFAFACSETNIDSAKAGAGKKNDLEYRITGRTVYLSFEASSASKSAILRTGDEVIDLGESVDTEGVTLVKFRVLKIEDREKSPLDPEVGMEGYILRSSVMNEMKPLK